jgi:hypothetical protein
MGLLYQPDEMLIGRGKLKCSEKNLPNYHFVLHESHINYPGKNQEDTRKMHHRMLHDLFGFTGVSIEFSVN